MKDKHLYELFIDELEDMYSCELQIIESLPKMIKLASIPNLKKALTNHLNETKGQVERIKEIFWILEMKPKEKECAGMKGILEEADEMVQRKKKSPVLDAAIISAAQKVEHYEIASYGTIRSFAKQLKLPNDIVDLLQESLDEEGSADKELTKIAEGTFFSSGVNKKAVKKTVVVKKKKK